MFFLFHVLQSILHNLKFAFHDLQFTFHDLQFTFHDLQLKFSAKVQKNIPKCKTFRDYSSPNSKKVSVFL